MTVIVETADLEGKREILQEQIASALQPDHLEIEDGLAMLAVVGRGMRKMRGTAARVCAALAHAKDVYKRQGSDLAILRNYSEMRSCAKRCFK